MRSKVHLLLLLSAALLQASQADRAIQSAMGGSVASAYHVKVLKRVPVAPYLDIVVALGDDYSGRLLGESIGIFLQRRTLGSAVYKLIVTKSDGCETTVERITSHEVVLSCQLEKEGLGPNHKFLYDLRSKTLTKRIDFMPFSLKRAFVSGETAVLVGTDTRQLVALQYDSSDGGQFRVLDKAEAKQWTRRVKTNTGTIGFGATEVKILDILAEPFVPIRFGPGDQFALLKGGKQIVRTSGKRTQHFVLPQTAHRDFPRFRPDVWKNTSPHDAIEVDECISASQVVNGTLWFAKGFYDGEGHSGVGGFGYFDVDSLTYRTYSSKEIWQWSATTMLVEPEAVWIGLIHNGEYGGSSGGILHYDRATESAARIELADDVLSITRVGNRLLLGTDFGAIVIENGIVHRYFINPGANGRLQVSEAILGY